MNEDPSKEPKENPRGREVSFPAQSWNHFGASLFLSKTMLPKADMPKVTSVARCFPSAEKWGPPLSVDMEPHAPQTVKL